MPLVWTPDTCVGVALNQGCRLVYRPIDGVKSNVPANYERTERTCSGHSGVVGVALATVVLEESRRRQAAITIAKGVDLGLQSVGRDRVIGIYTGQGSNRVLEVSFSVAVAAAHKLEMREAFDLQFGQGKAVVPNAQ